MTSNGIETEHKPLFVAHNIRNLNDKAELKGQLLQLCPLLGLIEELMPKSWTF